MRFISFLSVLLVVSFEPIIALAQTSTKSLGYVLQADKLAKNRAEAVTKLSQSDRDLIVIDASYDGTTRWKKRDVESIRTGKSGRKVLCYLSIGEAEDYRSYWKTEWDANKDGTPDKGAPGFLTAENPDWEGNYKVRYWHQEWQKIILHEVRQIVAQGFDGVYLDIIDGFEFFEYDAASDNWIDHRPNPETGNSYRKDMVQWVAGIRKALNSDGTQRWVIPQNGEALVDMKGYLVLIDAIAAEDVFTNGKRPQKNSEVRYRTNFLKKALAKSKPVYVVEYPRNEKVKASAVTAATAAGFSLLLTDRPLATLGKPGHKTSATEKQ